MDSNHVQTGIGKPDADRCRCSGRESTRPAAQSGRQDRRRGHGDQLLRPRSERGSKERDQKSEVLNQRNAARQAVAKEFPRHDIRDRHRGHECKNSDRYAVLDGV